MNFHRRYPVSKIAVLLSFFIIIPNASSFESRKLQGFVPWQQQQHRRQQANKQQHPNKSLQSLNHEASMPSKVIIQQTGSLTEGETTIQPATSYHLIWTRGFLVKFLVTTIGLVFWDRTILPFSQLKQRFWMSSIGLPLLASSCCLLQLAANYFLAAIGCLGLNTKLGPFRPYFLSLLTYLSFRSSSFKNPRLFLIQFSITFLPEIVHIWNHLRRKQSGGGDHSSRASGLVATFELDIPTMGCVACINKIDSSLTDKNQGVLDIYSSLDPARSKGGSAKVKVIVKSKEEAKTMSKALIETVESIGFAGSSITNVSLEEN